jgi:hypothetical protein
MFYKMQYDINEWHCIFSIRIKMYFKTTIGFMDDCVLLSYYIITKDRSYD